MPSTKTITVYKFDELSDKAKDNVRYKYIAEAVDLGYVIDSAKEEGLQRGFHIDEVAYSGFCSQGDGASWTGHIDLHAFIAYHLKDDDPNYARYTVLQTLLADGWSEPRLKIERRSFMYNHSNTMCVDPEYSTPIYAMAEDVIRADCPLQGANVQELYEGIDVLDLMDDMFTWAFKEAKKYADEIYRRLESAYDDEISDQQISLLADANDWQFDEAGVLI